MFTGIVQKVGNVRSIQRSGNDARIAIDCGDLDLSRSHIGDSIAVNGVCLTAVALDSGGFTADVSGETLARTNVGRLCAGARVNLELALTPSTPLGGHIVSGHVDGVGTVVERRQVGESVRFRIELPRELARYVAEKGSICVDGVSLTVNGVDGAAFDVNIVPHTLAQTTLGELNRGGEVNIEVDLIARYLERLMLGERAAEPGARITEGFLREHGFIAN
jgi:riboflavin synthase